MQDLTCSQSHLTVESGPRVCTVDSSSVPDKRAFVFAQHWTVSRTTRRKSKTRRESSALRQLKLQLKLKAAPDVETERCCFHPVGYFAVEYGKQRSKVEKSIALDYRMRFGIEPKHACVVRYSPAGQLTRYRLFWPRESWLPSNQHNVTTIISRRHDQVRLT